MTDNQRETSARVAESRLNSRPRRPTTLKALGYGALGVLAYLSFGVLVGLASSEL